MPLIGLGRKRSGVEMHLGQGKRIARLGERDFVARLLEEPPKRHQPGTVRCLRGSALSCQHLRDNTPPHERVSS